MLRHEPGDTIGLYRVVHVLGRGSFGVVVLGESCKVPAQRVALKLVPCDHLDGPAAAKARDEAVAEAELLQSLRHPHIVSCREVCWHPEQRLVWFVLDFMGGGDLQTYIKCRSETGAGSPDGAFVRRVLCAIGSALQYIHVQGVLHRDVKSANVLLAEEFLEIKLGDFGISKILEATGHAHTVVGTPAYLSPELVRGQPYGPPSDAWALGVCLYELWCLKRPFNGANQLALAMQVIDNAAAVLPPGCPADVARAIDGLLEKDPRRRLKLTDVLALSKQIAALAPRTPPPCFPPPPAPLWSPERRPDAMDVTELSWVTGHNSCITQGDGDSHITDTPPRQAWTTPKDKSKSWSKRWFRLWGVLTHRHKADEVMAMRDAQDPPPAAVGPTLCPKGHLLQRFSSPEEMFMCSLCRRRSSVSGFMWGCRTCGYDVCIACSGGPVAHSCDAGSPSSPQSLR